MLSIWKIGLKWENLHKNIKFVMVKLDSII